MLQYQIIAPAGQTLTEDEIRSALFLNLEKRFSGQRVLVLIPDHTRSMPLPLLFRGLAEALRDVRKLDFMVALGTHAPLSEESLNQLVGISAEERRARSAQIGLFNHAWDDPSALVSIGAIEKDEMRRLAGADWHASLPERVEIRINQAALSYDHILILGPTFPHEVAGFSGGAKYLFPGISGPEMINATHWLGALAGVLKTIGVKDTPVRAMIHAGAQKVRAPITLIAAVVENQALSGLFIGDYRSAWSAAADLSAQRHIRWCGRTYQRVLSCAQPIYDELWTGAKAMYKLEPVVAPGGELIIYAPHLDTVSRVHGKYIYEIGYHTLPYFLQQWQRFKHVPLGVLAHSTHVRGAGSMENGIEKANIRVTLASKIPAEDCARLNLGYLDPASIRVADWQNREEEGILYVPHAGEILYRRR
ncbi:MAG: DUF2088 domain-containing protein [Chloroflexi bacterium]|nr:DUF2088 domain-containing protein [Chloroflexota bacterium]